MDSEACEDKIQRPVAYRYVWSHYCPRFPARFRTLCTRARRSFDGDERRNVAIHAGERSAVTYVESNDLHYGREDVLHRYICTL